VLSVSPDDCVTILHAFEDNAVHEKPLTLLPGHALDPDCVQYHWRKLFLLNRGQG
jgi:hypothetical protein